MSDFSTQPAVPATEISVIFNQQLEETWETGSLEQVEQLITTGVLMLNRALGVVRDRKLYLERDFKSFDDYCQAKWGFNRRKADRLIAQLMAQKEFDPKALDCGNPQPDSVEIATGEDIREGTSPKSESRVTHFSKPVVEIRNAEAALANKEEIHELINTGIKPAEAIKQVLQTKHVPVIAPLAGDPTADKNKWADIGNRIPNLTVEGFETKFGVDLADQIIAHVHNLFPQPTKSTPVDYSQRIVDQPTKWIELVGDKLAQEVAETLLANLQDEPW